MARTLAGMYPAPEDIAYIADIGGNRTFFPTDDPYTRRWFFPRYAGGRLHEEAGIRFLMRSLKRDSVFVDVGAHLGYFSVIAASVAAKVFAIEPLEFLIQRIHRNAMANHRDNVSTIFAAVGETPGLVAMPKTGSASSSLDNESQHFVPMIRLDDYFAGDTLPTHLKIDTEGFEYQVLQGARRILESRPVILMEVHEAMDKFGHTRSDLYHLLADELGYEVSYARHRARNAKFARANVDAMAKFNDMMIICQPK